MWKWLHKYGSPKVFYHTAGWWVPWFAWSAAGLMLVGLYLGLAVAPADYQQGDSFRIIYIHVPSAFLSMAAYMAMATAAAVGMIWRIKVASYAAKAIAPVGATFTLLALLTGAIWGKPTWGTWWQWDARLTSELILLFLYLGFMGLHNAIQDAQVAAKAAGILALVGVVNIPIIHFSVEWWHTLHQGATLSKFAKPSMETSMLIPLLLMIVAFFCYFAAVTLARTRCEILRRESRQARWVNEL